MGEPVVLLHGGMCTAETFDAQTAALSDHYQVYLPDAGSRPYSGRAGSLDYDVMAADAIAFLEALDLGPRSRRLERRRRNASSSPGGDPTSFATRLHWTEPHRGRHPPGVQGDARPPERRAPTADAGRVVRRRLPRRPSTFVDVFNRPRSVGQSTAHSAVATREVTVPTLVVAGDDDVLTLAHLGDFRTGCQRSGRRSSWRIARGTDGRPDLVNRHPRLPRGRGPVRAT